MRSLRCFCQIAVVSAAPGLFLFPLSVPAETLLLRGGTVVDGAGGEGREADVWLRDGRILRIGDGEDLAADRELEVTGLVVAPGFIDTHAHGNPERTPEFENFLRMGVTTLCLGQDGSSPFAGDLEGWRKQVEEAGIAPNIAPFIGHGTIRAESGVGLDREPSESAIAKMAAMVEEAMAAGAFGMSTGLEYQPGTFARLPELVEVARPVAAADGVVMSHMRSEDAGEVIVALDELLAQGAQSGSRVHVSHIKVVYGRGAEVAEEVLARLDQAQREGTTVTADLYPYTASYTGIGIVFPEWAKPPFDYEEVVWTRREDLAEFLRARVARRNGPEATLIGTGKWRGKTLAEAAEEAGKPFEDLLIDIGPSGASGAYFVMDRAAMERFLVDPRVMICSDGSPTMLHPRGYGSFARILARYVRAEPLLSIEEAVRKMSGLPAATVGLDRQSHDAEDLRSARRGRIEEGWAADLVVFDPAKVEDLATFEEPHTHAGGFRYVIVNGRVVIDDEQLTNARPGLVLRKASAVEEKAEKRKR